ncbi:hypothetical protein F2Q68_00016105 [Brassica cretica]|uniref:Uncharacterized protein n=1 Tax=Brassica cretica TaxID=69181 RepID=A0A8S9HET2_BRACR|nr:hypothetical protein F2Q68_00016105 [Brassica cretica]
MPGNLFLPLPRGRDGFLVHSIVLHRFLGVALGSKEIGGFLTMSSCELFMGHDPDCLA